MKAEIVGRIVHINAIRTSKNGFKTRTFWIEETESTKTGKEFKNILEFELFSGPNSKFDNTAELDNLPTGSVVRFTFVPHGNIWKGTAQKPCNPPKCFNSLRVISKIEVLGSANPNPKQYAAPKPTVPSAPSPTTTPTTSATSYDDVTDEMPF